MSEKSANGAVWFGARLAGSQAFADLFRDGMALVEETAAYLDGPGRQESKKLYAQRRARLCHRKHAAHHAADAAGVLASAPSRGQGGRDVACPGQEGKGQGQALGRRARRRAKHTSCCRSGCGRWSSGQRRCKTRSAASIPRSTRPRPAPTAAIRWSGSSVCSGPPSSMNEVGAGTPVRSTTVRAHLVE